MLGLVVLVGACVTVTESPASAATAGWKKYDTNRDGWYETAVYFDSYGRVRQIYSASTRGGSYDMFGEVSPLTGTWKSGIWFDTNRNGTWDTYMTWYGTGLTAVLSNTRTEFDGVWDNLSLDGKIECFGKDMKLPLAPMEQDGVFNFWWSDCYDTGYGTGLRGTIGSPTYANMFYHLYVENGLLAACMPLRCELVTSWS